MRFAALRRSPAGRRARAARQALLLSGALVGTGGADGGADDAVAAGAALRVASYNVQFVTPDLPLLGRVLREWPGHKPNVTERAEAIAERLACFDVVALQETINDQRRREILDRLETAGRACGQPLRLRSGRMFEFVQGPDIERGSWLPLVGNELTLASRLPIVRTAAHIYAHAAEEDALAAKGMLHVRLARGEDTIDVFVTHLQSGQEHGAVRRAQIEELVSAAAAWIGRIRGPTTISSGARSMRPWRRVALPTPGSRRTPPTRRPTLAPSPACLRTARCARTKSASTTCSLRARPRRRAPCGSISSRAV
jgi:endonuclease/exonuclease/phosphatase family metal-dependent hydrolase